MSVTTPAPATYDNAANLQATYATQGSDAALAPQAEMVMHALGAKKYE